MGEEGDYQGLEGQRGELWDIVGSEWCAVMGAGGSHHRTPLTPDNVLLN